MGIGVGIGSAVMLLIYAPMAMKWKAAAAQPRKPSLVERIVRSPYYVRVGTTVALLLVATLLGTLIFKGAPELDFSSKTLRPRVSGAYDALDRLYSKLTDDRGLVSLIITGDNEAQVHDRLLRADAELTAAKQRGDLQSFQSTAALWPAPEWQKENLATLQALVADSARLKQAALDNGFTEDAFALTGAVLQQWGAWEKAATPIWPQNEASQWILRRTASHTGPQLAALGVVQPMAGRELQLSDEITGDGIHLASWNLLGDELKRVIPNEFKHLIIGLVAIVFVILLFGFGSLLDVPVAGDHDGRGLSLARRRNEPAGDDVEFLQPRGDPAPAGDRYRLRHPAPARPAAQWRRCAAGAVFARAGDHALRRLGGQQASARLVGRTTRDSRAWAKPVRSGW
ncbi:MAG: hypothetical protein QM796_03650 [Chthoniobacteraceae bacterium]